jgi:hypothetical protein
MAFPQSAGDVGLSAALAAPNVARGVTKGLGVADDMVRAATSPIKGKTPITPLMDRTPNVLAASNNFARAKGGLKKLGVSEEVLNSMSPKQVMQVYQSRIAPVTGQTNKVKIKNPTKAAQAQLDEAAAEVAAGRIPVGRMKVGSTSAPKAAPKVTPKATPKVTPKVSVYGRFDPRRYPITTAAAAGTIGYNLASDNDEAALSQEILNQAGGLNNLEPEAMAGQRGQAMPTATPQDSGGMSTLDKILAYQQSLQAKDPNMLQKVGDLLMNTGQGLQGRDPRMLQEQLNDSRQEGSSQQFNEKIIPQLIAFAAQQGISTDEAIRLAKVRAEQEAQAQQQIMQALGY